MRSLYASLEEARPYVLSVLRIIVALLFLEHGLQKFFGFPSAGPPMTSLLYVQGVIEIVGGILLLLGAYTRVVAFILAGDRPLPISWRTSRARSSQL
jgi:putative oxidoreductase